MAWNHGPVEFRVSWDLLIGAGGWLCLCHAISIGRRVHVISWWGLLLPCLSVWGSGALCVASWTCGRGTVGKNSNLRPLDRNNLKYTNKSFLIHTLFNHKFRFQSGFRSVAFPAACLGVCMQCFVPRWTGGLGLWIEGGALLYSAVLVGFSGDYDRLLFAGWWILLGSFWKCVDLWDMSRCENPTFTSLTMRFRLKCHTFLVQSNSSSQQNSWDLSVASPAVTLVLWFSNLLSL